MNAIDSTCSTAMVCASKQCFSASHFIRYILVRQVRPFQTIVSAVCIVQRHVLGPQAPGRCFWHLTLKHVSKVGICVLGWAAHKAVTQET